MPKTITTDVVRRAATKLAKLEEKPIPVVLGAILAKCEARGIAVKAPNELAKNSLIGDYVETVVGDPRKKAA